MVTLRDLARECGCSITSASRALKNSRTISLELRKKVHETAKELGYIPNNVAESMRTGKTNTLAIIFQETMNPYYSVVTHAVESAASEKGYSLIMLTANLQPEREVDAVYTALGKKVDGVLLFPLQTDALSLDIIEKSKVPYVLVGRFFEDRSPDCVLPDDEQGVYLTTKHLLKQGHNRILMLNSFEHISSSRMREKGYRQAIREAGKRVRANDVHYIGTEKGVCGQLVEKIFAAKNEYTAICCYNDVLGYEAYYTLRQMGVEVPKDVAITGVDDLHSYFTFPVRMTSAGYDIHGMARASVDLLHEKIRYLSRPGGKNGEWQSRLVTLNQHLVIGETS